MLRVSWKLLLITVLVVAGFAAMLALVVNQLREVAVGGPLYANLHRHAQLRQTLTVLRTNLAEIRTLTTTARHTTDPDELRALATSAGALQRQVETQLKRVLAATQDPAVTMALAAAEVMGLTRDVGRGHLQLISRGYRGLAGALARQRSARRGSPPSGQRHQPSPSGTRTRDEPRHAPALTICFLPGAGLALVVGR
jgi:hypothetical protein